MAQNIPTMFVDEVLRNQRSIEVPGADWFGGCNGTGSNAPGVGINSGNPDPKEQDWAQVTPRNAHSSHIGIDSGVNDFVTFWRDGGADFNDLTGFGPADALTAPGAIINAGLGNVNETGEDIQAGIWAWGPVPVA